MPIRVNAQDCRVPPLSRVKLDRANHNNRTMVSNMANSDLPALFEAFNCERDAHEHPRQDPVRSAHGLPANMDYFHAEDRGFDRYGGDHRVRTLSCAEQIPVHGLRPADLPGKPARHRDLPLGPRIETLSHGLPPAGPALDAGRCQRKARLAYPCGVGPAAHHPGEDAVRRRRTGVGPDQYRLRPGLDDHRSVPAGLSVGALPHHQGGGEDAHAARPAGQHSSEFYPHLGWQAARRSCPRYALAGSRSHLRRGSWLRRLCPPLCVAPSRGLLRHACQAHRVYRTSMLIASIRRRRIARPASFATRPSPWTASTPVRITPNLLRRIRFKDPYESGKTLVFITNNFSLPAFRHHLRALQARGAAGRWNSSSSGSSSIFGSSSSTARIGEYAEKKTEQICRLPVSVYVHRFCHLAHRSASTCDASLVRIRKLHFVTDPPGLTLFEKMLHTCKHLRETKTDATLRK